MDVDELPEVDDLEVAALAATVLLRAPALDATSDEEETSTSEESSEVR